MLKVVFLTILCLSERCIGEFDLFRPLIIDLLLPGKLLLNFEGATESPRALLIHLGSGCDAIDSHVYESLRLDDAHDFVQVFKNIVKHFHVRLRVRLPRGMRTGMNDTIHIKVECIELRVI